MKRVALIALSLAFTGCKEGQGVGSTGRQRGRRSGPGSDETIEDNLSSGSVMANWTGRSSATAGWNPSS